MEERITDYLEAYLKNNPGKSVNERVSSEIKKLCKSFQSLTDKLGYNMNLEITDEGLFVVQFSNDQGQVYTTYTFNSAIVS